MAIRLSDHFTYGKLLKFTFPSIMMMVFTSIYSIVDGLFVSNYVGKTAFAAVNIVMPFSMLLGGVGSMLGQGGGALVAKTLGEGKTKRAREYFSMIAFVTITLGILLSIIGVAFIRPVSYFLGADDSMIEDCVTYGRIILFFNTFLLMEFTFQAFLITAERPKMGLAVTVMAGLTNIVLDALFVAAFHWGIAGAAIATGISQFFAGILPFAVFLNKDNGTALYIVKTKIEPFPVLKACGNGSSEMMSSISGSITGILYNRQLMSYAGADGVAAYGVIMYASFIFIAIFIGYSNGSAPITGYHYGAGNTAELKNILHKSLKLVIFAGSIMLISGMLLAGTMSDIFVGYDAELKQLTMRALKICFTVFVVMGINVYSSSFFTALNNGVVSAAISFLRSLVLPIFTITVFPIFWGLDGIWASLPGGEFMALISSILFLAANKRKYGY